MWCWWATRWGWRCWGMSDTLSVTMEEMLHHARAVRRGVQRALVVVDMPYGSYQVSRGGCGAEWAAAGEGGWRGGGEAGGRRGDGGAGAGA